MDQKKLLIWTLFTQCLASYKWVFLLIHFQGSDTVEWMNEEETHCVKSVYVWSYSGPLSDLIRGNMDQNNTEYGHFLRSDFFLNAVITKTSMTSSLPPLSFYVLFSIFNFFSDFEPSKKAIFKTG